MEAEAEKGGRAKGKDEEVKIVAKVEGAEKGKELEDERREPGIFLSGDLRNKEEESKLERLRRENKSLRTDKKKLENNKTKHHNDERVCTAHSMADALKAKAKPSSNSSAILDKFGVKLTDESSKFPGTLPINSYKSGDKTNCSSPAWLM